MTAIYPELFRYLLTLPVFLFLALLIFYLPGLLIVNKLKIPLRDDENVVLSFGAGIILFLLTTITFFTLKIPLFIDLIYIILTIYAVLKLKRHIFHSIFSLLKQKLLITILLFGTLIEGFINFPSSFSFQNGQMYWSSQAHDGLWHIAVIEVIKQSFPPNNILYAGEKLFNYHRR